MGDILSREPLEDHVLLFPVLVLSKQSKAACILPIQGFSLTEINLLFDAPHSNTEGITEMASNSDLAGHADL